jgi:peptidoglycan hydrolase FlgJ
MSDANPMGIDNTLFQLQALHTDKTLSTAQSTMGRNQQNKADLEEASCQFESLLLNFMLREMRATIPESGLFPQSMAQDIFTSLLDEQYAGVMAQRGGIGLSRLLIDQFEK